uniref:Uncharacterized protein n=1 Tax=Romanomermis culicivorax TaxID=13658 RepID=A0A915I4X3_ROMCU
MIPNLLNFQNNVDNVYMELTQLDSAINVNGVSASTLRRLFFEQKKYFLAKKNLQQQRDIPEEYTLIAIY